MPVNLSKYISLSVSILLHSLVFVFFYFAVQNPNPASNGYIELGFSNEPAGGGSGGSSETLEEPEEKINTGDKKDDEKISPIKKAAEPEKQSSSPNNNSQQKGNGTGTGTGIGTGTGTGSGTGSGTGTGSGKGGFGLGLPVAPKPKEDIYLVAVEEMPEPFGGIDAINLKVITPAQAKQKGVSGTVFVQAFVDELGAVRKVLLTKGIGHGCDEAAMNAVSRSRFKPGRQNGKTVKVQVQIPVVVK
jgi:TonB family protein